MQLNKESLAQIKLPEDLIQAQLIKRTNRFVAQVLVEDKEALAHVPSSGRMQELLVPGAQIFIAPSLGAKRRTDFKLLLVNYQGTLVSVDSLLPNRLLDLAFRHGGLPGFEQYTTVRREYPYGQSRLDFLLTNNEEQCLVEVKSVTLVENGQAKFPDAPSTRGAKHLEELVASLGDGYRAAVIFVIQRDDASYFMPNDERDPHFGQALRRAHQAGVEVYALDCQVSLNAVQMNNSIPVVL